MLNKSKLAKQIMSWKILYKSTKNIIKIRQTFCIIKQWCQQNAAEKGLNVVFIFGLTCLKMLGALTAPYWKRQAVEQVFYFCPKDVCFRQAPSWSNARCPTEVMVDGNMPERDVSPLFYLSIPLQRWGKKLKKTIQYQNWNS